MGFFRVMFFVLVALAGFRLAEGAVAPDGAAAGEAAVRVEGSGPGHTEAFGACLARATSVASGVKERRGETRPGAMALVRVEDVLVVGAARLVGRAVRVCAGARAVAGFRLPLLI